MIYEEAAFTVVKLFVFLLAWLIGFGVVLYVFRPKK